MALTLRQSEATPDADDWVTLDEAAAILGQSVRTLRSRAGRQWVGQGLATMGPPPSGVGKPVWFVSRATDPKLLRCPTRNVRDDRVRESLAAKYPQHLIDKALKRADHLRRWLEACKSGDTTDRAAAERIVSEARRVDPDGLKVSARSLLRWSRAYNRLGPDGQIVGVEGLVDRYGRGDGRGETRSPEATEFFYDIFRTENKVSVAASHEVTLHESRRRGWQWPASYRATTSWLDKNDDRSMTYLMRNGKRAWAQKFLPHAQIRYDKIEPGYFYQGDHTQADFWCIHKGKVIRPWFTTFQDMRSRCIVGWHVGPVPHQDAILVSLNSGFSDWAIPSILRLDNGKDFASRTICGVTRQERNRLRRFYGADWQRIAQRSENLIECSDARWLGVTGELGIELIYAIPYSPWSKGTTERFYGTLQGRFSKMQPTYCGSSPQTRPECVEQIKCDPDAVPTLERVRKDFAAWLDIYHRTAHGGLNGDTPIGVWKTATRLRKALADELSFLMSIRGLYKVGANGVRVTVGGGPVWYGAKSVALKRWMGRKVLIAADGNDLSHAYAYTPDRERRELIGRLEPNEFIEPLASTDDAREAIAEKRREQAVMHKAARASANRTKRMSQRMNEHARMQRIELLSTGTDDKHPEPRIVPVHTGFSNCSRSDFETQSYRSADVGDVEQLFDGDERLGPVDDVGADDEGMDDLFIDGGTEEADEGLDGL